MGNWDSSTYEGKLNWCKYYQIVSRQYYDAWKAGRTEMDHEQQSRYTSERARVFLFDLIDYYGNDGQLKPAIVKARIINSYRLEQHRKVQADLRIGNLQRKIMDAYYALAAVEGTRENENGVKTPEYENYYALVNELGRHDRSKLICYKSNPILWGAFVAEFGKISYAMSWKDVDDAMERKYK